MASIRELIVVLLDVGSTMSRHENSTQLVEDCVQGITRLVEKKILFYPKDQVGLVLFGTNDTDNRLAQSVPGFYKHVKVLRTVSSPDVALLKQLSEIKPESANSDFIDALIVGIDLLTTVEPKKGTSTNMRLFLVTDAAGEVNTADLETIVNKMEELKISLNVVGVDFADDSDPPQSDHAVKASPSSSQSELKPDIIPAEELKSDRIVVKSEFPPDESKLESWSQSVPISATQGESEHNSDVKIKAEGEASLPQQKPTFPTIRQLRKNRNESVLMMICSRVRGAIVPVYEALDLMNYFASRSISSHPNFRGFLEIGGVVRIPIWTYLKTKEENFPKLVSISKLSSESVISGVQESGAPKEKFGAEKDNKMDITAEAGLVEPTIERTMGVLTQKTFVAMDNPDEEISFEQQVKGYKYGKTYVPANNSIAPYTSTPCVKVIGFTSESSVPRHFYTSNTEYIVPYSGDEASAQAISALCHALKRTGMVGIVRVVKRKNSGPMLGVISPHIGELSEILYLNRLPFNDDLRMYGFASLINTEFSTPPKHAIPTERQLNVTEDFINSLNLSQAAVSSVGEPMEALKPKHTFNPSLQYFFQVILSRALKPHLHVPPMDASILQHVSLDEATLKAASKAMQNFHDAFTLTKTETKEKENRRRFWSEAFGENGDEDRLDSYLGEDGKKPKKKEDINAHGLHNIQSLLRGGVDAVSNVTPVEDFQAMMARRDVDLVDKAIEEMQIQILGLVNDSYKNAHYDKAIDCINVLRAGCIKEQESEQFNHFLYTIKATFKDKQRNDFWLTIQQKSINLISAVESPDSTVSLEQVRDFYASDPNPAETLSLEDSTKPSDKGSSGGAEDLFDLLG